MAGKGWSAEHSESWLLIWLLGSPLVSDKLQRVQNSAARLVTRAKKNDHITPILQRLHWLPVNARIVFKILLITYKALHNQAPGYIIELLSMYKPRRSLRSAALHLLTVP